MNRTLVIIGSMAIWGGTPSLTQGKPSPIVQGQAAPQESRANYKNRIRAELDEIKAQVKEKKKDADKALLQKTRAAERELVRFEKTGKKDWSKMKARVERAMKDLRKNYKEVI